MIKEYFDLLRRLRLRRMFAFFFEAHLFDLIQRTDTAQYINLSTSNEYNVGYQGSYTSTTKKAIKRAQEIFKDFRLIDLGSGKGKVIIIASLLGIKKVIGIEVDKEINKIAIKNLSKVGITESVEVINIDVTRFDAGKYPGINVAFMYNPFGEIVIHNFFKKNHKYVQGIIYVNPIYDYLILEHDYILVAEINGRYPIENVKIFMQKGKHVS